MADPYLDTVARLEPDIAMIDTGAALASISISLKRIADAMDSDIAAGSLLYWLEQIERSTRG